MSNEFISDPPPKPEPPRPASELVKLARLAGKHSVGAEARLDALAQAVDAAMDAGDVETLGTLIERTRDLQAQNLPDEASARLHYFLANAYAARGRIQFKVWEWENNDEERSISHLRRAIAFNRNLADHPWNPEVVLTNLGNAYSRIGRPIAAVPYWEAALVSEPGHGPSEANWAEALLHAAAQYPLDEADATQFRYHAAGRLVGALGGKALDAHGMRAHCQRLLDKMPALPPLPPAPEAPALEGYAAWVERNNLHLDLVHALIPSQPPRGDPAHLDGLRLNNRTGISPWSLFNVIKREYASARFFAYESMGKGCTTADEGVRFIDTLDLPYLSHRSECAKAAFRSAYSLFERIAVFLDTYYDLQAGGEFTFRSIWYTSGMKTSGLRPQFKDRENWPLRGLFWLSKDLYEDAPGFHETTDPDAHTIHELRNAVEHRFVSLHVLAGDLRDADTRSVGTPLGRPVGYHMSWFNFRGYLLNLLQRAREAILYLAAAVAIEERRHPKDARRGLALQDWNPRVLDLVPDFSQ